MKTELKQTYRSRATRLTPPRVRLSPSRTSRRRGRPAAGSPRVLLPNIAITPVVTEHGPQLTHAQPATGDALQLYLREIGQVQLLTPKEEIELARRIKRGDKRAREHMIKANLRLVVK